MLKTFGSMPTSLPAGMFKAVSFPILAKLNEKTPDGRMLMHPGGDVRSLPQPVRASFKTGYGHMDADNTGVLHEVTFDDSTGILSGRGFLANDEFGRRHARAIYTGMMTGNSVDLAEVSARFVEDMESGDMWVEFYAWKLAMTTGVGTPAFAEAYAKLDDPMSDDELMASLVGDDPMEELVASFTAFDLNVMMAPEHTEVVELVASGIVQPYDAYFQAEPDVPRKLTIDPDTGWFAGHLGMWDSFHDGIAGRRVRIPRPPDGYASFNKPGVPTDRGLVNVGPIFLYGGHKRGPDLETAYGGIENTWGYARITEGKLGPWLSGMVRPSATAEQVFDAGASRISGHWIGDKLKAIVSVNAEGFDVPGEIAASVTGFRTDEHGVLELVASFDFDAEEIVAAGAVEDPRRKDDDLLLALLLDGEDEA